MDKFDAPLEVVFASLFALMVLAGLFCGVALLIALACEHNPGFVFVAVNGLALVGLAIAEDRAHRRRKEQTDGQV